MDIKEKVRELPTSPGVYIMKDRDGAILYVGKAGNIRKRVSSYFHSGRGHQERIRIMVSKIADITCLQTSSEAEALIYENSLIKQLTPKYNVALRDDKSYPRLKLTIQEKFPRLILTRKKLSDGALYFGPYTSAKLLREAVIALKRLFPLRTCLRMPKSVCLNYHIKQCPGPCEGRIDEKEYGDIVEQLKLFLDGKRSELIKHLTKSMVEASRLEDFEKAARFKARIEALSSMKESGINYVPSEELRELESMLGITVPIEIIEAFDVSNIMGQEAVGSMVYFWKGRPKNSEYRKFKIKTVVGADDYSMMREIVRRRYSRQIEEGKKLPDLVLIDGGKGHLAVALSEMEKLGLSGIPLIGLAKEFEHIFVKGKSEPIILPRDSKALHLLECIRDEAHRFAITYHKKLRSKKISFSELDAIKGLGRRRKRELLSYFGSVDKIRAASFDEISRVRSIDEKTAERIVEYFKEQPDK